MALFTIFDTTMDGYGSLNEPERTPNIWGKILIIFATIAIATVILFSFIVHTMNTNSFIYRTTVNPNYVTHQFDRAGGN